MYVAGNETIDQLNAMRPPVGDDLEFDFDDLPNLLMVVPSSGSENGWRHFSNRLGDSTVAENLSHTWPNVDVSGSSTFNWHDLPNPLTTAFCPTTVRHDWNDLPNPLIVAAGLETSPFNWQDLPNPLNAAFVYQPSCYC